MDFGWMGIATAEGWPEMAHCVGSGFIVLDVVRNPIDENTTIEHRYAGGTCGNVLAILAYFGIRTTAIGRIGHDAAGSVLVRDLVRQGVDVGQLHREPEKATPVIFQECSADSDGRVRHRFTRNCPVCGTQMARFRSTLVANVAEIAINVGMHDVFFFDRVSPGTLQLARKSYDQGALVVFEPSGIRDKQMFLNCLSVTHVLKYSHERLQGIESLTNEARVPLEIETHGANGLRYRLSNPLANDGWQHLTAVPAPDFVDSAGSGDWCTAGLIASILASGDSLESLTKSEVVEGFLAYGQALAAVNCAYLGARGAMYVMESSRMKATANRLSSRLEVSFPKTDTMGLSDTPHYLSCSFCTISEIEQSSVRGSANIRS